MILSVAGIATLRSVRQANISTAASRMTSAVRYLYDLAVVTNRPYRLVVDLASGAYWGEPADPSMGCGAALLPSDEEMKFGPKESDGSARSGGSGRPSERAIREAMLQPGGLAALMQGPAATGGAPGGGDGAPVSGAKADARAVRERLLERHNLSKGLSFSKVMTGHQDEPTEEGKAEIYFFPSGYVEKAYIYMQQGDEVYTIETVPLKGAARVHRVELDSRDLLDES
jgi:general secretion pathway protein H